MVFYPIMNAMQAAIQIFEQRQTLRTRDAVELGIHPRTLYALRDRGEIRQLSRGLYTLAARPPTTQPDLVVVAGRIPKAVIGFVSALAFHELTTQIPHAVHIALPAYWNEPSLDYPPLEIYRMTEPAYSAGIERHPIAGVEVPIYDAEKSVADLFKFRSRIGKEIALEALRFYLERPNRNLDILMDYAEICRVAKVIRPYVEALA